MNKSEKIADLIIRKFGFKIKNIDILNNMFIFPISEKYKHFIERLEFIGDKILNLSVADLLYKKHLKAREGELTLRISNVVDNNFLFFIIDRIGLLKFININSILNAKFLRKKIGSIFEAIIGLIYYENNLYNTILCVQNFYKHFIQFATDNKNPKSKLQEFLHSRNINKIQYKLYRKIGDTNNILFIYYVKFKFYNKSIIIAGSGTSRKNAENNAAKRALMFLNNQNILDNS